MFRIAFHTAFLSGNVLEMRLKDLDGTKAKLYPRNFRIRLEFEESTSLPSEHNAEVVKLYEEFFQNQAGECSHACLSCVCCVLCIENLLSACCVFVYVYVHACALTTSSSVCVCVCVCVCVLACRRLCGRKPHLNWTTPLLRRGLRGPRRRFSGRTPVVRS
jgi:C2 domain of PTEN tumour-suppressor protein